jgi:predicted metal-binding membrane protein
MRHGAVCVGCCWMLMALLFVGGIMNLRWIAGLTLVVGIEKLAPRGEWIARVVGVGLVGWGIVTVVTPALSRGLPLP